MSTDLRHLRMPDQEKPMKVLSPAKINLYLYITGKRGDGYHELESLMCPVSLYDEMALSFRPGNINIACSHPLVPENADNLAHRAAALFYKAAGIDEGVSIILHKRIPVGAGLGGGSSNAASILNALNRYYGNPLSTETLSAIALSIGADVPFFIRGLPAIAKGIGEKLNLYKKLPHYYVVLVAFEFSVSTAYVYKNLNLGLTKYKKINKSLPLEKQDFDARHDLDNNLETVTIEKYPVIEDVKKALKDNGAEGALMTGSGPTVFGLFKSKDCAISAKTALTGKWQLHLVETLS